ncbi:MAG: integrase [marine bacterium B5-7]|nr:MAG: integrase [marine bacterium B5-7]
MYERSGTFYFVDHEGKWINLGRSYGRAIEQYNNFNEEHSEIHTIDDLLDRYLKEVSPTKAPTTHKTNIRQSQFLRAAFGSMRPGELTPRAIYMYMDARKAKVRANRELALLSHMFRKAIRWGVVDTNPCIGIERNPEKPRDRYVEDWEYVAFKETVEPWMAAYMDLKLLTGLRQGDMLSLTIDQLKKDGIHILVSKTQKQIIIRWSDHLRAAVRAAVEAKTTYKAKESNHLFCTRRGDQYSADGFRSIWHRRMVKAVEKGVLEERFREHDLRAKTGSDTDLEHAKNLLSHSDGKTTQRHYRRRAEIVEPLR